MKLQNEIDVLKNVSKDYDIALFDIDRIPTYPEAVKIVSRCKVLSDEIPHSLFDIWKTKNGFHVVLTIKDMCFEPPMTTISGLTIIQIHAYLGTDNWQLWKFLRTGRSTLFNIRRGKENRKYLGSVTSGAFYMAGSMLDGLMGARSLKRYKNATLMKAEPL